MVFKQAVWWCFLVFFPEEAEGLRHIFWMFAKKRVIVF